VRRNVLKLLQNDSPDIGGVILKKIIQKYYFFRDEKIFWTSKKKVDFFFEIFFWDFCLRFSREKMFKIFDFFFRKNQHFWKIKIENFQKNRFFFEKNHFFKIFFLHEKIIIFDTLFLKLHLRCWENHFTVVSKCFRYFNVSVRRTQPHKLLAGEDLRWETLPPVEIIDFRLNVDVFSI